MSRLSTCRLVGLMLLAGTVGVGAAGQATTATQKPTVKSTSARPIVSVDGRENYMEYCAVCHGRDAKGHGPAAPAMKVAVPDLTAIATRNNGTFNALRVEDAIRKPGMTATPAHGVDDMPIWGDVFKGPDAATTRLRIGNLVKYLESIQQPAGGGKR